MDVKTRAQEVLDKIQEWREDDAAFLDAACTLLEDHIEPFLRDLAEKE